jgi:predicted nucleotidyltransferase component of viral defense system
MVSPHEDKSCFASQQQRAILHHVAGFPLVHKHFFLTGGTALSVYYLHHRTSEDLDLFTVDKSVVLNEISFWIKNTFVSNQKVIKSSQTFLSLLIHEVKVDFVIDRLSGVEDREYVPVDSNTIMIDSPENIAANKLCTLVSRTEPKDFIDFFFLMNHMQNIHFDILYEIAQGREALLDDPPTAAFQIEEGLHFIKNNINLIPSLKKDFNFERFIGFYEDIAQKIYQKFKS